MNVFIITNNFPPDKGGRASRLLKRAKFIEDENRKITVLCPNKLSSNIIKYNYKKFNISVIRIPPLLNKKLKSFDYWKDYFFLPKIIRPIAGYIRWVVPCLLYVNKIKPNIDILYTMNNPVVIHILGILLKEKSNKWVAEFRDPVTNYVYSKKDNYSFFIKLLEKKIVKYADAVCIPKGLQVTVNELKRKYRKYSNKIYDLGYSGINTRYFEQNFNYNNSPNKVKYKGIFAGSFHTSPIALFNALNELNLKNIVIEFYTKDFDKYLGTKNCHFKNMIPYYELIDKYRGIDFSIIFDKVKINEGSVPFKIFELIAIQKPIFVIGHKKSFSSLLVSKNNLGCFASDFKKNIQIKFKYFINSYLMDDKFNEEYFKKNKYRFSLYKSENKFLKIIERNLEK